MRVRPARLVRLERPQVQLRREVKEGQVEAGGPGLKLPDGRGQHGDGCVVKGPFWAANEDLGEI